MSPDPNLHPRHAAALERALTDIHARWKPVGIVLSGTVARGTPDPASDLDLVVIHTPLWRQRVQWVIDPFDSGSGPSLKTGSVPVEIFVNPAFEIGCAFAREVADGRPVMLHMLATGVALHDPEGVVADLRRDAAATLARGPDLAPETLTFRRYALVSVFEDAADIADRDPDRALAMVSASVVEAARLLFLDAGRWTPREKALLTDLDTAFPNWGEVARSVLRQREVGAAINVAAPLVQQAAGGTGFFAWEGAPQPLEP